MSVSRSFPSYSCLTLEQTSFSLNDLEQEHSDKFELNESNSEKILNFRKEQLRKDLLSKDKLPDRLDDSRCSNKLNDKLSERLNEKLRDKIAEKLIDRKLKGMDDLNPNHKLTRKMTDKLIDTEIALVSSIPDDQIRKRRTSRPRIILNRRSESLSMPRERAKINLNKTKRIVNANELGKIEFSDFKQTTVDVKTVGDHKAKESRFVKSREKIRDLINKTKLKHSKSKSKDTNSKDNRSMKPNKLERSRSQEEFSDFKRKRSSRVLDDLDTINTANHLYSREILMSRAKRNTLKVTILIVLAFV